MRKKYINGEREDERETVNDVSLGALKVALSHD